MQTKLQCKRKQSESGSNQEVPLLSRRFGFEMNSRGSASVANSDTHVSTVRNEDYRGDAKLVPTRNRPQLSIYPQPHPNGKVHSNLQRTHFQNTLFPILQILLVFTFIRCRQLINRACQQIPIKIHTKDLRF